MLTFRCAAETNSNRWIQMMMLIWWCVRLELHELTLSKAKLFFELNVELNTISFKKNLCTFNPLIYSTCRRGGWPYQGLPTVGEAGRISAASEPTPGQGRTFRHLSQSQLRDRSHVQVWTITGPFLFSFANSSVYYLIMGKGRPMKKWTALSELNHKGRIGGSKKTKVYPEGLCDTLCYTRNSDPYLQPPCHRLPLVTIPGDM